MKLINEAYSELLSRKNTYKKTIYEENYNERDLVYVEYFTIEEFLNWKEIIINDKNIKNFKIKFIWKIVPWSILEYNVKVDDKNISFSIICLWFNDLKILWLDSYFSKIYYWKDVNYIRWFNFNEMYEYIDNYLVNEKTTHKLDITKIISCSIITSYVIFLFIINYNEFFNKLIFIIIIEIIIAIITLLWFVVFPISIIIEELFYKNNEQKNINERKVKRNKFKEEMAIDL